jgi:hypothetical protein
MPAAKPNDILAGPSLSNSINAGTTNIEKQTKEALEQNSESLSS